MNDDNQVKLWDVDEHHPVISYASKTALAYRERADEILEESRKLKEEYYQFAEEIEESAKACASHLNDRLNRIHAARLDLGTAKAKYYEEQVKKAVADAVEAKSEEDRGRKTMGNGGSDPIPAFLIEPIRQGD